MPQHLIPRAIQCIVDNINTLISMHMLKDALEFTLGAAQWCEDQGMVECENVLINYAAKIEGAL